jgi:hypothetical protein
MRFATLVTRSDVKYGRAGEASDPARPPIRRGRIPKWVSFERSFKMERIAFNTGVRRILNRYSAFTMARIRASWDGSVRAAPVGGDAEIGASGPSK